MSFIFLSVTNGWALYHSGRWRTCVSGLSHSSTNTTSFPSHRLLFSHAWEVRGEITLEKKFCLNRVSNSKPLDHESDTLINESPGRGQSSERISAEPGIEPVTSCFQVLYAYTHWPTWASLPDNGRSSVVLKSGLFWSWFHLYDFLSEIKIP